jgi:hypothetical protein
MQIRPVGAEIFHADKYADMTKLIVPSRNFVQTKHINNHVWFEASAGVAVWDCKFWVTLGDAGKQPKSCNLIYK